MLRWQKLYIITNIIADLCTLISNVKDSILKGELSVVMSTAPGFLVGSNLKANKA